MVRGHVGEGIGGGVSTGPVPQGSLYLWRFGVTVTSSPLTPPGTPWTLYRVQVPVP